MGKYMRKAKITGEVAVMEVAQSSLGVKTRAKTLALQRLQTTPMDSSSSYLQLRSRRLEKKPPSLLGGGTKDKEKDICCGANPRGVGAGADSAKCGSNGSKGSKNLKKEEKGETKKVVPVSVAVEAVGKEESEPGHFNDLGVEASFGENVLEFEARSTRETTPSSLIRGSDTIGTPGSTTRPTNSSATNRRVQNSMRRIIPTAHEMEEFFAEAEERQQRIFTEKYNFDPINETPLPGRYEWEILDL